MGGGAADRVRAQPPGADRVARCSAREDREFLQSVALKTWRYFETFVGPEDHALPPDNVQLVPELTVAHRTSPTNIGMALLATLAAHDFGFIDTDELADRIDATLDDRRKPGTLRRSPAELGMTRARWRRFRRPTSRRSTAATSRARS